MKMTRNDELTNFCSDVEDGANGVRNVDKNDERLNDERLMYDGSLNNHSHGYNN